MERTVRTGERREYASAVADLWERLGAALARLERIAEAPPDRIVAEASPTSCRSLQYSLHAGAELARRHQPPPGARRAAHEELVAALAQARDATAEVAIAAEVVRRRARRAAAPRMARRALPRPARPPAGARATVRSACPSPTRRFGPPARRRPRSRFRRLPSLRRRSSIAGALLFTAGAVLAAWPALGRRARALRRRFRPLSPVTPGCRSSFKRGGELRLDRAGPGACTAETRNGRHDRARTDRLAGQGSSARARVPPPCPGAVRAGAGRSPRAEAIRAQPAAAAALSLASVSSRPSSSIDSKSPGETFEPVTATRIGRNASRGFSSSRSASARSASSIRSASNGSTAPARRVPRRGRARRRRAAPGRARPARRGTRRTRGTRRASRSSPGRAAPPPGSSPRPRRSPTRAR